MRHAFASAMKRTRAVMEKTFGGPRILAYFPAFSLGGYWIGGENALVFVTLFLPLVAAIFGKFDRTVPPVIARDGTTSLAMRDGILTLLNHVLANRETTGRTTACLVLRLDDFGTLKERFGRKSADDVLRQSADRLRSALRDLDLVARLDEATFAVALGPVARADLETLVQLAGRIQEAISEPISIDATKIYVSCSIGFCLATRSPALTGDALLDAAERALTEAQRNGPSGIRCFSEEMGEKIATRNALIDEVSIALEAGQIRPWFQPQVSTDTGFVTGFEALARWDHPDRGLILPNEFLSTIEQAGLLERLSEVILYHALTALRTWDRAGLDVPCIGVNFSNDELRNPKLIDKIRWELDRFDLSPERLCIEVLETVMAGSGDEIITRNISALAKLGCGIDLDDFGTGHASIANIRRFAVGRIKIDRSFVTKVDQDPDQQRMIAAILKMAEQLDLDTLAEGVESVGEHAMLAQLGCAHIQGFGLARPMPFEDTLSWIASHHAKLSKPPQIGRRTG